MILIAASIVETQRPSASLIVPCRRHGDIKEMFEALGFCETDYRIIEEGFIDNEGLFYNRKEAYEEALRCGQLCETVKSSINSFCQLLSEDLY